MNTPKIRRFIALLTSSALVLAPWAAVPAHAGLATSISQTQPRPQVVIAIGNSQSMDGDLSGAIMTGSGNLSSGLSSLYNSSSPVNYSVPAGFTPPMTPTSAPSAPYTYQNSSGTLIDNGASRLNVAKAGLSSVLSQYLPSMDFALEDYSTSGTNLYTTWVYYMSPSGGFSFANSLPSTNGVTTGFTSYAAYQSFVAANPNASPAPTRWVNNPCYQYGSASSSVNSYCSSIASLYGSSTLKNNQYMQIGASSDDPNVNDVLYAGGLSGLFVAYNGPNPATPYPPNFSLSNYNNGSIYVSYDNTSPDNGGFGTSPTNAGYVPYSPQVVYAQRGFGYYVQSLNAISGNPVVSMTNLGANPSATAVSTALTPFTTALKPETNNSSSSEIKALAYQSPTAGLVQGAGTVLSNLTASCAGQYVILVTDGLPTMDLSGNNWPPLGSAAGQGYGVNAAFYGIAGNAAYGINDDSGNVPGGQTQGGLDSSKTNDQALIDTITAIQTLNKKGIKTYVVGLGAGVDANANPAAYAALNAMAIAGGTGQEYPANNIPAFNAAINSIAAQIFQSIAISAPIAPSSVQGGTLVYSATSNNVPGAIAGHVMAYGTVTTSQSTVANPVGTASGPAKWDAGDSAHMPATTRKAALYSTAVPTSSTAPPGSGPVKSLATMGTSTNSAYDASAFGLSATTCVPNIATEVAYTLDPSFNTTGDNVQPQYGSLGFPTGVNSCSYLAGRQLNWMLGSMSPNDQTSYLGAPGTAAFTTLPGYVPFAVNNKGREKLVLFTSNDGFLYAADATTGGLVWGWMPRPFLSQLQNYTQFQTAQNFDGGYTLTDAVDTATNAQASDWASYVVGTAQGGGYHYALKLSSNNGSTVTTPPSPQSVAWAINVPGGTSPQQQAPLVVTVGGMQYAVFVVNTTSGSGSTKTVTSTLYEINVATGQPASGTALSATLPFVPNSSMSYDTGSGTLWMGDSNGGVWSLNLSGTAPNDVISALQVATTSPQQKLNYVGYYEINGLPYVWAASQTEISVFALSGATSQLLWASDGSSGYQSSGGSLQAVSSSVVMPLQSGGQISAAPVFVNGILVVPVYVPPSASSCGVGDGYYDLFDLLTGGLPKVTITYKGNAVANGVISMGQGIPLSPTVAVTNNGAVFYPYTTSSGIGGGGGGGGGGIFPVPVGGSVMNKPIAWRQY
jgi:type IV pilus assembly protein PilY1